MLNLYIVWFKQELRVRDRDRVQMFRQTWSRVRYKDGANAYIPGRRRDDAPVLLIFQHFRIFDSLITYFKLQYTCKHLIVIDILFLHIYYIIYYIIFFSLIICFFAILSHIIYYIIFYSLFNYQLLFCKPLNLYQFKDTQRFKGYRFVNL